MHLLPWILMELGGDCQKMRDLYFGSVDHPNELRDGSANCDENHYFYTGMEWVANGDDNLTNSKNTLNGCVGCHKILILENIYASSTSITPTKIPTIIPSNYPSSYPTIPTVNPSTIPSVNPSAIPTVNPSTAVTVPTVNPTKRPLNITRVCVD